MSEQTQSAGVAKFDAQKPIETMSDIKDVVSHMEAQIAALIKQFERLAAGCLVREVAIVRCRAINTNTTEYVKLTVEVD